MYMYMYMYIYRKLKIYLHLLKVDGDLISTKTEWILDQSYFSGSPIVGTEPSTA